MAWGQAVLFVGFYERVLGVFVGFDEDAIVYNYECCIV